MRDAIEGTLLVETVLKGAEDEDKAEEDRCAESVVETECKTFVEPDDHAVAPTGRFVQRTKHRVANFERAKRKANLLVRQ